MSGPRPPKLSASLWRRRIAVMGVVALAIALPVTLLTRDGDGDDGVEAGIALYPGNDFASSRLGVSGSAPAGWRVTDAGTHVVFEAAGGYGRVVVSAPGSATRAGRIFRDAIDALKVAFRSARKGPTMREARIDGRPTRSSLVALERRDGREVQGAVVVAEGIEVAYLVELFVNEGAAQRRFGEAQAIIDSLELTR